MSNDQIGYRVIEDIPRPAPALLAELRRYSTPELCDGMVIYKPMDYRIKPMVTSKKICGPAVTLQLMLGDSLLVTKAIAMAKPGDVLVIAAHGSCSNALWGDHRSLIAKKLGLEGVVMDGAFRDIDENEEIGFPIYAKAVSCGSSTKNSNGEINIPVCCGGVTVRPGDIIVGDRNGVCVVPLECAEEVLANAQKKQKKMEKLVAEIERTGRIIPENYAAEMEKLGY